MRAQQGEQMADETESLTSLLRRIVAAHPDATAVVSGAILSTYQRTRIESVVLRLSLLPLAPLWQYPFLPTPVSRPTGLLEDIAALGLEARIVKVASGGLDEGFLWGDLRDEGFRRRVEKGVGMFGGSALGEGGEFETLVLDGPSEVWKCKLVVEERERVVGKGEGGEAWLDFQGGTVVRKEESDDGSWRERLNIPRLWEEGFESLVGRIGESIELAVDGCGKVGGETSEEAEWTVKEIVTNNGFTLNISNLTTASAGPTAQLQMTAIIAHLCDLLATHNRSPSDVIFTTLLLRSMADFALINAAYVPLFRAPNPPARVTVSCGDALPQDVKVMASFIVNMGLAKSRDGLHVQSRSYWAPANIGPYSQATAVRFENQDEGVESEAQGASLVFVAGQIPLVPVTMELVEADSWDDDRSKSLDLGFCTQTSLALQHLWRIGKAMEVEWWMGGVAFITAKSLDAAERRAKAAWLAWSMVHEPDFGGRGNGKIDEEDGLDPWDKKFGGMGDFANQEKKQHLPDFERLLLNDGDNLRNKLVPGFFAVQVDELPRGSQIEWHSLGVKNADVNLGSERSEGSITTSCALATGDRTMLYVGILPGQPLGTEISKLLDGLKKSLKDAGEARTRTQRLHWIVYTPPKANLHGVEAQIIPCRSVWGPEGTRLSAGIVIHIEDNK